MGHSKHHTHDFYPQDRTASRKIKSAHLVKYVVSERVTIMEGRTQIYHRVQMISRFMIIVLGLGV